MFEDLCQDIHLHFRSMCEDLIGSDEHNKSQMESCKPHADRCSGITAYLSFLIGQASIGRPQILPGRRWNVTRQSVSRIDCTSQRRGILVGLKILVWNFTWYAPCSMQNVCRARQGQSP
jgi:hypothetical protein